MIERGEEMDRDKETGILFLSKLTGPAIWGDGSILRRYPVQIPVGVEKDQVALLGIFSGDETYPSIVLNGRYKGMGLNQVYAEAPELFGDENERRWGMIPISIGVGHASQDLSIQIHPTEEYAVTHEGCHGKSECWYIIDVDNSPSEVVLGHTARTLEEFRSMVEQEQFDRLLLREPLDKGDFFNLKAGTVHALQKGTTFIEVCTACNLTYRIYDYHRKDRDGKERPLHLDKVYANVLIPYEKMHYDFICCQFNNIKETQFTDNENFSVRLWEVDGSGVVKRRKPYYACFVTEGEGMIDSYPLKAGDNFMISSKLKEFKLTGRMKILAAHG